MALTDLPANRDPLRQRSTAPPQRRLDRWMSAGRQLVDGVAGTRPGGRPPRGGIDGVGRWMGERLDWLLEEGDDWREPWQERESHEAAAEPPTREGRPGGGGRRPLEAISRRGRPATEDDWPDDGAFTIPRWQRREPEPEALDAPQREPTGRPVPRSSRRRQL
jgi:hypothetical protein